MSESSAESKIGVGVIGVGQIGKQHLAKYGGIDGAEVVALADIDESELQRVGAMNGVDQLYTDFRQMLRRDDVEAVDVCLHNNFHMPVATVALQAGKEVFCEKPMAGSYVDAAAMLDVARSLGRRLSIQVNDLFAAETKAAKALIDGGHLGKLYHARSSGHRRRGRPYVDGYGSPTFVQKQNSAGGALYDMGVYHISTIMYLLGNPDVLRISGKTYQEMEMEAARRETSGYNVEELGLGFVRLEDNITVDIVEAWAIHLETLEGSLIVGSKGGVRLDPFGFYQSIGDLDLNATADLSRFTYRLHNVRGQGDEYDGPQQHWIAALQGRVDLLPTAEIALNTMLISEGIYLSEKLGREVSSGEVKESSTSTAVEV